MTDKKLLFSVTKDNCEFQTFRCGGHGGQNVNKVSSGVRCIHKASGAVAECRETRSQLINKRRAFKRMSETKEFKQWHRLEVARLSGQLKAVDAIVDDLMQDANLRIEEF